MSLNIVLFQPEIPQNTGNIARTCAATGCSLHLIRPLGFKIDDAKLKRAGLDYWHLLDITYYDGLDDFFEKHLNAEIFCFSTKSPRSYTDIAYPDGSYLFFGPETRGTSGGFPERKLRKMCKDSHAGRSQKPESFKFRRGSCLRGFPSAGIFEA